MILYKRICNPKGLNHPINQKIEKFSIYPYMYYLWCGSGLLSYHTLWEHNLVTLDKIRRVQGGMAVGATRLL